ncbi:MAG: hypothetical protein M3O46_03345, partial [Myxococcota bacterium]|nr:hypothetical protein [Myxococcota bacterium]
VPARAPGSLDPCTVLGATQLSSNVPTSSPPGPPWADGVPYTDAGDFAEQPSVGPQCGSPAGDAGTISEAGTSLDSGAIDASNTGVPAPASHPSSMAMRSDMPVLYVADDALPVIHVIDLHDPTSPRELQPLLATNVADPAQRVAVGPIAISPTTHDYKTYLYAVDARQGSLMVYEITDPATSPHTPLQRPHPELNPLAPLDRLRFSAPVATIAFARHDWPVPSQTDSLHQYTGLLCNPNPHAHPDAGAFVDRGAYYRADQAGLIQSMVTNGGTVQTFPSRLRGIFAFATLSSGTVVTIDVDDWDAPCRRPDPMAGGQVTGALDIPQTDLGDLDPYHAPQTYNQNIPESPAVTLEAFFPVSAPHRLRSGSLLRADPTAGVHVPNLLSVPQLYNAGGAPTVLSAAGGSIGPLLLPAPMPAGFIDPTYIQNPTEPNPTARTVSSSGLATASATGSPIPRALFPGGPDRGAAGVRVSFDDPTAHQDQDWTVTYEGALPTVSGISATMSSALDIPGAEDPSPRTLTFSAPGAHFCARGIEDWDLGQARANQVIATIATAFPDPKPVMPAELPRWTSDYLEITDDLLASTDPYWGLQSACQNVPYVTANDRYNACLTTFGAATDADTHFARDLPILHARDDSLEVGRFGWFDTDPNGPTGNVVPEQTTNRVVVQADPSNAPFLKLTRCCFHDQASFKVRTGGQWVAAGTSVGLLHHVKADPSGACVLSCDPRDALMNARAFDIPWAADNMSCTLAAMPTFDRDSPLAMRNPMFSFVAWSGCPGATPQGFGDHTLTTRDLAWRFSMRGSFSPLTVSLTSATTGSAVSPQSMRYIQPLGQLAVVDGENQGLVLIDLNLVTVVNNYF